MYVCVLITCILDVTLIYPFGLGRRCSNRGGSHRGKEAQHRTVLVSSFIMVSIVSAKKKKKNKHKRGAKTKNVSYVASTKAARLRYSYES